MVAIDNRPRRRIGLNGRKGLNKRAQRTKKAISVLPIALSLSITPRPPRPQPPLILLAVVELLACERRAIHLSPEVGDIGHNEGDDKRHNGHGA